MIDSFLYLPDYPIGHLIALPDRGADEEGRQRSGPSSSGWRPIGSVTPDLWMKHATGAPVGPEAMLAATEKALTVVKGARSSGRGRFPRDVA